MTTMPPPHAPNDAAQIYERGYRHYDGERLGPSAAIKTVAIHAFTRALGVRRPAWAKVLPIVIVFLTYIPGIVFVGLVALTKNSADIAQSLPDYSDYYGQVVLAVMLFVAFLAPDMLCPDRRSGMIGLYLASPLTRDTYLLGKALAIFVGLALVLIGPQMLMLLANTLQGSGVGNLGDSLIMALRILGAGAIVCLLFTTLSLALSSFTDRKGFATAAIILVLLASSAIGGVLSSQGHNAVALLDISFQLPDAVTARTFGLPPSFDTAPASTAVVYGAAAAWIVALGAITRIRYQRLTVTR